MRRRTILLATAALLPLAGCGIFSTNTTNGVTTVTLNVANAEAWGNAFINAATLISSLAGVAGTAAGTAIAATGATAKTDLATFVAQAGSQVTLIFDTTSVPAFVTSLLGDGQTLSGLAGGVITSTSTTVAQSYLTALQTIVALFQAAVSTTAAAAPMKMTQAQALATLRVK